MQGPTDRRRTPSIAIGCDPISPGSATHPRGTALPAASNAILAGQAPRRFSCWCMVDRQRKSIGNLSLREYCLYRAICVELEALQQAILFEAVIHADFESLATAMRDRRLLIEWLRELHLPPSADYADTGLTAEVEDQILAQA